MKRLTRAERELLKKFTSKIGKKGGIAASSSLTPDERKARARAAGIASGKARKKKAGKR